ncbi:MAG: metal ABC transporter ATP-binding protein [Candidatus Coproplasma sp.]
MVQIKAVNLSVGYEGNAVCKDINFEVNAGDYLCIIGENGAGKSTLMKTLLGLVPPVGGKIERGEGITGIGYLPQQDTSQGNFPATVWEIALSGCVVHSGWRPFFNRAEKALALEKLKLLGIDELKNRSFGELSGGQRQKVLLARVLCATDRIMLLDEPVTGLDPQATLDLYETVERLNKDCGTTVIMITHDLDSLKYADKVLQVGQGKCEFCDARTFTENNFRGERQ